MRFSLLVLFIFIGFQSYALKAALHHIASNEENFQLISTYEKSSDTIIYVQASSGIGLCKSYSFLVLSDRKVYLNARENMYLEGYFLHTLNKAQFKRLSKRVNEMNWESYGSVYPVDSSFIQGVPSFEISRTENHIPKKIICQYDCPKEIMHIIDYLEEIIPNLEWNPVMM